MEGALSLSQSMARRGAVEERGREEWEEEAALPGSAVHGAGNHRLSTDSEGEGWEKGEGGVGEGERRGGRGALESQIESHDGWLRVVGWGEAGRGVSWRCLQTQRYTWCPYHCRKC